MAHEVFDAVTGAGAGFDAFPPRSLSRADGPLYQQLLSIRRELTINRCRADLFSLTYDAPNDLA